MPRPSLPIRFLLSFSNCFLAICTAFLAGPASTARAQLDQTPLHDGSYFVEARPAFSITATLQDTWTLSNPLHGKLKIFAPTAPDLDNQRNIITSFTLTSPSTRPSHRILEQSPEHRALQELDLDSRFISLAHTDLCFKLQYSGTLYSRRLVRRAPPTTVPSLSKEDRLLFTSPTRTLDFRNPTFTSWLHQEQLLRHSDEDATTFAARAFTYFTTHGKYGGNSGYDSLRTSNSCQALNTDCGGFSLLFTSVLRANNIPARCLFGRWALTQTNDYGQYHVIAEFFAPKTGWVPVDISSAIVQHPKNPMATFGNVDARLLVFHIDPDLQPAKDFWHGLAQYLLIKWEGPGNFFDSAKPTSHWTATRSRPEPTTRAAR